MLDPIALSHWIMGDVSVHSHGLILCTDSYSVQDVVRLMNVLIIKYRLDCTLRSIFPKPAQFIIYIRRRSINLLHTIITPNMNASMLYKLEKSF
jgi:hypothetical protein